MYQLDERVSYPKEDIQKWADAGREDILDWTSVLPGGNSADIWINKHSLDDDLPVNCPWLRKDENNNLSCDIQELKPSCCANYGHNKKHAIGTNCSFYTGKPFKPTQKELDRIPTVNKWKDYNLYLSVRVNDTNSLDEVDIINFVKYQITGEKQYYNDLGFDSDLSPKEVFAKLKKRVAVFHAEVEEDW